MRRSWCCVSIAKRYTAIIELTRQGWGRDNPVYRQLFTSRFIPGATAEQIQWWSDLCRRSASPEMAARLLEARMHVDIVDLKTVRNHVTSIFEKLGVHSRAHAIVLAKDRGYGSAS